VSSDIFGKLVWPTSLTVCDLLWCRYICLINIFFYDISDAFIRVLVCFRDLFTFFLSYFFTNYKEERREKKTKKKKLRMYIKILITTPLVPFKKSWLDEFKRSWRWDFTGYHIYIQYFCNLKNSRKYHLWLS
jgi:hypothetical protein